MILAQQFISLPLIDHFLIAIVLMFNLAAPRLGMWMYSLFALPGTVAHELAHFVVAFLLRAKPSFPNLIPMKQGSAWQLGSVRVRSNFVTIIPIALAPFLLFPVSMWYAVSIMSPGVGWWHVAHAWISGTLFMASLPSRQDWFVAMPAIVFALLVAFWFWLPAFS